MAIANEIAPRRRSGPFERRSSRRLAGVRLSRRAVALGLAGVLVVVGVTAALVAHSRAPLSPRAATRVFADPGVRALMTRDRVTDYRITAGDRNWAAVTFLRGWRIDSLVLADPQGRVGPSFAYSPWELSYGSRLTHSPGVLLLLIAAFALSTASARLLSTRNADVLALLAFVIPVLLFDRLLLVPGIYVSFVLLVYLGARCLWEGLVETSPARGADVALWDRLTRHWSPAHRERMLIWGLAGLTLCVMMLTLSSGQVVDIGYASLHGATLLAQGVVPYGHEAGVFHGDTYPLLNYVLHVPASLIWPAQHGPDDDLQGALVTAAAALTLTAALVYRASRRAKPFSASNRARPQDRSEPLRMAVATVAFLPMLLTAAAGTNDLLLAAALAGAFATFRRPGASSASLAFGCWTKLAPLVLLPLWLARLRGRCALAWALVGALAVSAGSVGLLLALGGPGAVGAMVHALAFQFDRSSPRSFWVLARLQALVPVVQGSVIAMVMALAWRVRRDDRLARDPRRMAALAGAALILLQLSATYWSYSYLPWVLPLVMLSLLRGARNVTAPARSAVRG